MILINEWQMSYSCLQYILELMKYRYNNINYKTFIRLFVYKKDWKWGKTPKTFLAIPLGFTQINNEKQRTVKYFWHSIYFPSAVRIVNYLLPIIANDGYMSSSKYKYSENMIDING